DYSFIRQLPNGPNPDDNKLVDVPAVPKALDIKVPANLAFASRGAMVPGVYQYAISFYNNNPATGVGKETSYSQPFEVTLPKRKSKVILKNLPAGPAGTTQRIIYRTAVGAKTGFLEVGRIDTTTNDFTDDKADSDRKETAHVEGLLGLTP